MKTLPAHRLRYRYHPYVLSSDLSDSPKSVRSDPQDSSHQLTTILPSKSTFNTRYTADDLCSIEIGNDHKPTIRLSQLSRRLVQFAKQNQTFHTFKPVSLLPPDPTGTTYFACSCCSKSLSPPSSIRAPDRAYICTCGSLRCHHCLAHCSDNACPNPCTITGDQVAMFFTSSFTPSPCNARHFYAASLRDTSEPITNCDGCGAKFPRPESRKWTCVNDLCNHPKTEETTPFEKAQPIICGVCFEGLRWFDLFCGQAGDGSLRKVKERRLKKERSPCKNGIRKVIWRSRVGRSGLRFETKLEEEEDGKGGDGPICEEFEEQKEGQSEIWDYEESFQPE